ncbi:MAG: hypothetical protein H3C68_08495 [Deltaproteobacteria bacterium]|nr:hypothetical protein [Deltaproteobacteria bacterium]MBZ0219407.1 hypothetical protein [Deltaproteobacteria bacterium]
MKIGKRLVLGAAAALLLAVSSTDAESREWSIVGPRALGMGGAGVAVANDATASYWNPAAFGFFKDAAGGEYGKRKWSAVVDAGAGVQVRKDLGEQVDAISQIDFDALFSGGTISTNEINDFIQIVDRLKAFDEDPGRALVITANGGLRAQAGRYGLNGYVFSEASLRGGPRPLEHRAGR